MGVLRSSAADAAARLMNTSALDTSLAAQATSAAGAARLLADARWSSFVVLLAFADDRKVQTAARSSHKAA